MLYCPNAMVTREKSAAGSGAIGEPFIAPQINRVRPSVDLDCRGHQRLASAVRLRTGRQADESVGAPDAVEVGYAWHSNVTAAPTTARRRRLPRLISLSSLA